MSNLYPSWIELPAADLDRATRFYRAIFALTETPRYDEPPAKIILLRPSDKNVGLPGVSLVHSPLHRPADGGAVINFHLGDHAALQTALATARQFGATLDNPVIDLGDGTRYINLLDTEGNRIALSSYEEV